MSSTLCRLKLEGTHFELKHWATHTADWDTEEVFEPVFLNLRYEIE